MLFMREAMSQEVNGGFIVVRNSLDVQNIFKTAMEYCKLKSPHADQDYFNSIEFKQLNIHWDYIDYNLVAWGNNIYNPKKTLFHHAVCASGLEEKLHQQDKIAAKLEKTYTI